MVLRITSIVDTANWEPSVVVVVRLLAAKATGWGWCGVDRAKDTRN